MSKIQKSKWNKKFAAITFESCTAAWLSYYDVSNFEIVTRLLMLKKKIKNFIKIEQCYLQICVITIYTYVQLNVLKQTVATKLIGCCKTLFYKHICIYVRYMLHYLSFSCNEFGLYRW